MNFVLKYFCLLSIIISLAACDANNGQNSAENSQNTNSNQNSADPKKISANDNIEELEITIKIPFHPEEVLWNEENLGIQTGENRIPSQNEKKLTAVFKFTPEDSAKIVAQASSKKAATPTEIPVETWFPAELIAQSELSGDDTLKGNVYVADDFFQAPYLDGRLIRMENSNYFVLELFSK